MECSNTFTLTYVSPTGLKKKSVCNRFWFIKWDAAMHLFSHMYHQLGEKKFY